MRFYLIILLLALLCPANAWAQSILADESAAVILAYSRIGEDEYPGSSLRTDQFQEQMHELASGSYKVLPLPEIVSALKEGRKLPGRAVAISFDGAYKSLLKNAIPLLLQNNLPFTIFFASGMIDSTSGQYMSWQDLKALQQNKNITFGLLPAHYRHYSGQDRATLLADINQARVREREMLGTQSTLFSYPFGEYDPAYRALVEEQGFAAAFGAQSGVAYAGNDLYALPRFSLTENYGDIEHFQMVIDALPLPVTHIEPENPMLQTAQPLIGFSVDDSLKNQISSLSCFITGQSDLKLETVSDTRVELRLSDPLLEERNRMNCTLPVADEDGTRWRWFGMLLFNDQEAVEDSSETEP